MGSGSRTPAAINGKALLSRTISPLLRRPGSASAGPLVGASGRSCRSSPGTPRSEPGCVRAAARRAGIEGDVSPHWLRHAHASHALDRGAPIPWCRRRWGMPISGRPASTPALGRTTARRGIWGFEAGAATAYGTPTPPPTNVDQTEPQPSNTDRCAVNAPGFTRRTLISTLEGARSSVTP